MIKLSIIIPVFNCENYINQCISSIISQIDAEKEEVEVIIINDKSTDNSLRELEKYKKFNFLKIINLKKNKGVSNARNIGIGNAIGKYIFFIDGDDLLINGSIKMMLKYIDKYEYDIIRFSYKKRYKMLKFPYYKLHLKGEYIINKRYNDDIFKTFINYHDFHFVWGELISLKYAQKILFDSNLIVAEDLAYNLELYFSANKIFVIDKPVIYYRINYESITHNINIEKLVSKAVSSYNSYYRLHKYDKNKKYNTEINKIISKVIIVILSDVFESQNYCFEKIYNDFLSKINNKIKHLDCIDSIKKECIYYYNNNKNKRKIKKILSKF